MGDEANRLIDDDEILVLIENRRLEDLGHLLRNLLKLRLVDGDHLTTLDTRAARLGFAVHRDVAVVNQTLCGSSRQARNGLVYDLVEPRTGVLGVDEHTAVVIDIETGFAEVRGNGTMTLRHRDNERVVGTGERVGVEDMRAALQGRIDGPPRVSRTVVAEVADEATEAPVGLRQSAALRREAFDIAIASADADAALEQALGLEQDIHDWSRDTLQSDDIDVARAMLRAMLVDLATAAQTGLRDEA